MQTHSRWGLRVHQAEPRLRSQNIRFWVCPQDPCQLPALCPLREGPARIRASLDTPAQCPSLPPEPVLTPPAPQPQVGSRSEVKLPGCALWPALDLHMHPGSYSPEALWAVSWAPALAQSQGASPAGEEGKYPFVCSFGLCSRVSGDKSQVGRGAWRLSRLPRPEGRTGTHRCGGREPAEGPEPAEGLELRQPWPWSCPAALLPPPLDPPGSHLLQEASRMWLPSCLPPLASEPLQWACDGGAAFET